MFILLFLKIVERKTKLGKFKIEGENFAKYSGNPESLKKWTKQWESSPINMHAGGEDFLRVLCKLFYLWFHVSSDQWKNSV